MTCCVVRKICVRELPLIDDIVFAILETAIDSITIIGIYKNVVKIVHFRRQMEGSSSMLTLLMGSWCLLVCRIAWTRWSRGLFMVGILQFSEMLNGLIKKLHIK